MAVRQHGGVRVSHMRRSWLKVAVDVPGKLFHSHVIFNFVRSQGKDRKILQVHVQSVCHGLSSTADKVPVQKVFTEQECGNNIQLQSFRAWQGSNG